MNIKNIFLLILIFIFPQAGSSETNVEDNSSQPVYRLFGTILPITGKYSQLGEKSLRGIRTAIEQTDKQWESPAQPQGEQCRYHFPKKDRSGPVRQPTDSNSAR